MHVQFVLLLFVVLWIEPSRCAANFEALHAGLAEIRSPLSNQTVIFKGVRYPWLGAADEEAYSYYGIRYGAAKRFEVSCDCTLYSNS